MDKQKYVIGIIDDHLADRKRITESVGLMCKNLDLSAEILSFDSAEAVLQSNLCFDVLFLDEELADGRNKKLNGHELKEILRHRNTGCMVIYISSHREYVDTSFGTNVMGFVIKGSENEASQLMRCFVNCLKELDDTQNVIYLESQDHHLKIVYAAGYEKVMRCTMDRAEEKLKTSRQFVRCQRSYIVNLDYVEAVEGNFERFIMKNGAVISVSRGKKDIVKRKYMDARMKRMEQILGE